MSKLTKAQIIKNTEIIQKEGPEYTRHQKKSKGKIVQDIEQNEDLKAGARIPASSTISNPARQGAETTGEGEMKEVQQAEALRLADELVEPIDGFQEPTILEASAASELRRQHVRIAELEAELEAVGAGGVEPLSKGFVRLSDVLARLEQGFGANSAPVTTIKRHFEMQAASAHPAEGVPAQAAVPVGRGEVLVTVSGFTGSGKSAIAGEIEIMCRALGLQVEWPDGVTEKNMTHADWTTALELYNPRVRIIERNVPRNTASGADQ